MLRDEIKNIISRAADRIGATLDPSDIPLEHPTEKNHGDYASSVALKVAGKLKKAPSVAAREMIEKMKNDAAAKNCLEKTETAGPGFLNLVLSRDVLTEEMKKILSGQYGNAERRPAGKINLEFISANPTGPLTLGNGRGGFMGDALANVLERAGFEVTREYYINDSKHSAQIRELGKTVKGEGESYKSPFLTELLKDMQKRGLAQRLATLDEEEAGFSVAQEIQKINRNTIENKLKIKFDVWFSEQSLYEEEWVKKILRILENKNLVYKKDGALWIRISEHGGKEDVVVVRSDGSPTYTLVDIVYHLHKFSRGFDRLINFWGADHHGHILPVKIGLKMVDEKNEDLAGRTDFVILQFVRLLKNGREFKMSKRAGQYVTTEELVDEVGVDAARFFFLMNSADRHMDFDMDLAKEQSEKNPVYYVQYAHARLASILRKAKEEFGFDAENAGTCEIKFSQQEEFDLIRELIKFPEIIEDTARDYQVQRLPHYALELARNFHHFYQRVKVLSENKAERDSRIALILAAKIILSDALGAMGISSPEKM